MDMFKESLDEFSPCGRARYMMGHVWDASLPALLSCALNPSVGNAKRNDPTNERLERRAVRMEMGGVIYVNLFPLVSKSPQVMKTADDPFIDRGRADEVILEHAEGNFVLCGWGTHGTHHNRSDEVARMLKNAGHRLYALGITANGQPKHPLYVSYSTEPFVWFDGQQTNVHNESN